MTLTIPNISLLRLKQRVENLIDQQGEDAPVCAFIFGLSISWLQVLGGIIIIDLLKSLLFSKK